jgi:DNA repair exonuclease SbcCD ATPase subunit
LSYSIKKTRMEDPNAPATKGDIADVKAELKGDIADVKAELKGDIADVKAGLTLQNEQLRSEMNHIYNDLVERIADSETKLLKAFYNYAESNQQRLAQIDSDQAAIRNRLGSIESRLLEVEKRLNMPPAA